MIVTCIYGGLGNQMFQYAVGRCLAKLRDTELKLDTTFFPHVKGTPRKYELNVFSIVEDFATDREIRALRGDDPNRGVRVLRKVTGALLPSSKGTYFKEPTMAFDPSVFDTRGDVYLEGYWQSEKYFREAEETIRADFRFRDEPTGRNREMAERIGATPSVSIHVRRGDYVTNEAAIRRFGFRGAEYVDRAVKTILDRCSDAVFYVFSDDIAWCRGNLNPGRETVFVDQNAEGGHHEDMRLMSLCRHNIITNSSFSWWAAWLNANPDKTVIAPKEWYREGAGSSADLVPESWVQV